MADNVPAAVIREMRRLHEELDEELSRFSLTCRRCGSCCHFGSSGLFLYLSTMEAVVFFEDRHLPAKDASGEICPYLTAEGCSNRRNRSIGCRTYFCQPKFRVRLEKLHEEYLARVKKLSDRFHVPWDYSPLNVWMEKQRLSGR